MRLLALVVMTAAAVGWADESRSEWHRVVGLLQYLEGDYAGALATKDAEELAEQRGLADEAVQALKALGPDGAPWLVRAEALKADIVAEAPAEQVVPQCRALAADLVKARGLSRAPRAAPDLKAGQALFAAQCASCHGAEGRGDGPAGKALTPAPANFHDAERMATLSPYKVFNTTTFGITGTPMPAFPGLADADRWNVAFFISSLRHPACVGAPPAVTLEALATSTDDELARAHGAAAVPCLRSVMPSVDEGGAVSKARSGLERARQLAAANDWDGARTAVVDAYLEGIEPLEPTLRARNGALVERLEQGFTKARVAAQSRSPQFDAEVAGLLGLLDDTRGSTAGDFWSVFVAALFILLREGFEATVVVGALLAVMKKMQADAHVRVVHLGWVSALVFGVLAFVFGQALLAGANREWLETVVALFAVVMLLYAALWLNARANMSVFMTELRTKMKDALGRGSMVGLFFISFTSVGRETVETALFLQGLAGDSPEGVRWGSLAGGVALLGLVLFVRTVGFRLPMQTLFKASTVLLVATAVMLLGKGLHGLQELGVLPLSPVPFITLEPLGIHADLVSLVPQLVLALGPLGYWWWSKRSAPRRASSAA
ncbi:MAG: FTR1 family protein [Myxococcaceae bacterium]|jgi:high-affinity iron transporter|nr:FTR1 family protein [Myxococcaceae bacterium]